MRLATGRDLGPLFPLGGLTQKHLTSPSNRVHAALSGGTQGGLGQVPVPQEAARGPGVGAGGRTVVTLRWLEQSRGGGGVF